MLIAFTYLPGFVTMVFRGMPTVWRGRHRLICCWLIFMQAVHPGQKTLEEMARWTPATLTAWRFGRLLTAAYWNVHLLVSWLVQDLLATLPPPANGVLYLLNWLRVFGNAAASRMGHGVWPSLHARTVPSKKWWASTAAYAVGRRVIAALFGLYAPEAPTPP